MDKTEKLKDLLKLLQHDTITPKQIEEFLVKVLKFVKDSRDSFDTLSKENLQKMEDALARIESESSKTLDNLSQNTQKTVQEFSDRLTELKSLIKNVRTIKPINGRDGLDGLDGLQGKQGIKGKDGSPDTREQIIEKINLGTNDSLKISADQIDGFAELKGLVDVATSNQSRYPRGRVIRSVVGGTNVTVDNTDPNNPIINVTGSGSGTVTSIASADGSITVVNPTTTVDLTVVKAPKLSIARNINGVAFDGTANITVTAAAGTLTGNTLNATVVTSSLTSIGDLTSGSIGTGFVVKGVNMTLGSDANYDTYYRNSSGVLTRLANGTTGQILTATTNNAPSWSSTISATNITVGTTTISSGNNGRILYNNSGTLGEMTTTGSGTVVALATSPVLTTPNIGVATATSVNGLTITSTNGTLTLVNGSSLVTAGANSITLTSTGATNVTLPTSGTLYGTASGSITSSQLATSLSDETGTGVAVFGTTPTFTTSMLFTSGFVMNWNSSNVVITHTSGILTMGTGELRVSSAGTNTASVATLGATQTFTNKRITKRLTSVSGAGATPTTNTDTADIFEFTALATAITSMTTNLSGTPLNGDMVQFMFLDNATARAITWGTSFANGGLVNLPTTTVISTMLRVLVQYQTTASLNKWVCIAVA